MICSSLYLLFSIASVSFVVASLRRGNLNYQWISLSRAGTRKHQDSRPRKSGFAYPPRCLLNPFCFLQESLLGFPLFNVYILKVGQPSCDSFEFLPEGIDCREKLIASRSSCVKLVFRQFSGWNAAAANATRSFSCRILLVH